jgi:hypothetical protein
MAMWEWSRKIVVQLSSGHQKGLARSLPRLPGLRTPLRLWDSLQAAQFNGCYSMYQVRDTRTVDVT